MLVFFQSGLTDEKLTLAKVEKCDWGSEFSSWVYEAYPNCYKKTEEIDNIEILKLPNGYNFINFNKPIGSLPGVHPVYEATEECVQLFLKTVHKVKQDEEEEKRIMLENIKNAKMEREERKLKFSIIKTHNLVRPSGGENGIDGYLDADIKTQDGEIRMVARNVFDFGYYVYPKRLEGTEQIFMQNVWNENEKEIAKWLREFSPFTTETRM